MAAIRVYELARDLNMTNKSLIEKIKDMDIDVEIKSHMSALEDEALGRQAVEMRGLDEGVSHVPHVVPAVVVAEDEYDVGPACSFISLIRTA